MCDAPSGLKRFTIDALDIFVLYEVHRHIRAIQEVARHALVGLGRPPLPPLLRERLMDRTPSKLRP